MPVEIRELIIKAFIDNSSGEGARTPAAAGRSDEALTQYLDQVIEIFDNENER
ncbi:MAG: DUF5908 family protein [Cyclobacteriaceae bacterium]